MLRQFGNITLQQASEIPDNHQESYYNPPALTDKAVALVDNSDHIDEVVQHFSSNNRSGYSTPESSLQAVGPAVHSCSSSCSLFTPTSSGAVDGSCAGTSCISEDRSTWKQKLKQLEETMLGPDADLDDYLESSFTMQPEEQLIAPDNNVKQTILACARAIEEGDTPTIMHRIADLEQLVSVCGDPIQRMAAYLLEGLKARLISSGHTIYKSMKCCEPASSDLFSFMKRFFDVCPYFKFGYLTSNGAIAEAIRGERKIHIIDFQIAQGTQWLLLVKAFGDAFVDPPSIRITGIDDSLNAYARGGGLHIVGQRLSAFAAQCRVPLEFRGIAMEACKVKPEHLDIRAEEALVVNFPLTLHHLTDESVGTENHRDRILRMVKAMGPKIVTLVEEEANTNTATFYQRVKATVDHYGAIFESLDVVGGLDRSNRDRINVEQHCLAREIVNIVACEGHERVERHELFGKWRARLGMAGFTPCPLNPTVNATIRELLRAYSSHYSLEERDGVLFLGWKNKRLVFASAWR